MNTVATAARGGLPAAVANLKAGLSNVRQNIVVKGGKPILRMGRDGIWIFGAEDLEVQDGSRWAVNPLSLQHGYICWKVVQEGSNEKPALLGEEMTGMFNPKPDKHALPDYGHPWEECISFDLLCLNGDDKGEQVLYKTSSVGGLRASREFIDEVIAHLDVDANTPVPVVLLKSDHYPHKTYGKTYYPVFEVVDWVPMDDEAPEVPEPEAAPEPEAKPTRRRAAAPEPAPEPEAEDDTAPEEPAAAAPSGERRRRRRV